MYPLTFPAGLLLAVQLTVGVPVSEAQLQQAVTSALPPLRDAAVGHIAQKSCFGCHNQGPPVTALHAARHRGYRAFSAADSKEQITHIHEFLATNEQRYRRGQGTGGQVDTAGTLLLALEQNGDLPSPLTEAVVEYLLQVQSQRDFWKCSSNRPPSEASDFTTTYLALRGLRVWGTPEQQPRIRKRQDRARAWLLTTWPADTEDAAFRLLALREVKADREAISKATEDLLSRQSWNGGWCQKPGMTPDAYATGTALVAVNWSGVMPVSHRAYQRGLGYLIRTQRTDGTWMVESRSKPFQPYYEGGFPHGKAQFISSTASGWATLALILATPPSRHGEN